jgi:putative FmdB family regulatory protein
MPRYEFLCEKCNKPFELTMTIAEHEKGKVRCPIARARGSWHGSAASGETAKKS